MGHAMGVDSMVIVTSILFIFVFSGHPAAVQTPPHQTVIQIERRGKSTKRRNQKNLRNHTRKKIISNLLSQFYH